MGLLEVEINVERFDEVGNRVCVFVSLLANNANKVLQLPLVYAVVLVRTIPVRDNSRGEVSENPWAAGLNGVDVGGGEEKIGEDIAGGVVVEVGEERPVDQPGAVVKLANGVVEKPCLDRILGLLDFLHGTLPVGGENFTSQLTPCGRGDLVVIGGENTELVQKFRRISVATAAVLESTVIEKTVDHPDRNSVLFLEELQVGNLIASQVAHHTLILQ